MAGDEQYKSVKDKELTKRKLLNAVQVIFKEEGYQGLGVNKVAKVAGVSKKLIYRYFGSYENLIEAYVLENDYWLTFFDQFLVMASEGGEFKLFKFALESLTTQFTSFMQAPDMQRLILWELSAESTLMKSIHRAREAKAESVFEAGDAYFEGNRVNFRALSALLVGGIYYTILHARFNGGLFCGIDLNDEKGQQAVVEQIKLILEQAFGLPQDR